MKALHSLRTGKQSKRARGKQASGRGVTVTPMLVFGDEVIRLRTIGSQCWGVSEHARLRGHTHTRTLTFRPVIVGIITASRCSHITIC